MKTYLENERGARGKNIRASVCAARMLSLRQNKRYCRVGGHAPPQRHRERSVATTKTRLTGRKQNKRKRILLSSRHILYISSVLISPNKSRHLPTTFFTAAVSATRNAFVLSSAFMTGQSW